MYVQSSFEKTDQSLTTVLIKSNQKFLNSVEEATYIQNGVKKLSNFILRNISIVT